MKGYLMPIYAPLDFSIKVVGLSLKLAKDDSNWPLPSISIRHSRELATDVQKAGNFFARVTRTKSFEGTEKNIFCIY